MALLNLTPLSTVRMADAQSLCSKAEGWWKNERIAFDGAGRALRSMFEMQAASLPLSAEGSMREKFMTATHSRPGRFTGPYGSF